MQARGHVHFISRDPIEDSNGETVKRIGLNLVGLLVAPYVVSNSGRPVFGSHKWSPRIWFRNVVGSNRTALTFHNAGRVEATGVPAT